MRNGRNGKHLGILPTNAAFIPIFSAARAQRRAAITPMVAVRAEQITPLKAKEDEKRAGKLVLLLAAFAIVLNA